MRISVEPLSFENEKRYVYFDPSKHPQPYSQHKSVYPTIARTIQSMGHKGMERAIADVIRTLVSECVIDGQICVNGPIAVKPKDDTYVVIYKDEEVGVIPSNKLDLPFKNIK